MVLLQDTNPLIKRRVLYIGSAVPLDTAKGLEAIQKPLLERYPVDSESAIEGYDTILSVRNDLITMQYVDDDATVIQFPVSSLSMCAAVRCVNTVNAADGETKHRFVSLNDPMAGGPNASRPAIFTMMTRRTQGRQVLECHGFICASPKDAMELVKSTQRAGENYKRNETLRSKKSGQNTVTPRPVSGISDTSFQATDFNQTSTLQRSAVNGFENGEAPPSTMRLIPGERIVHSIKPGPEFFEPVSKQGYFYSSNQAEVKKFNIKKLHNKEDKENIEEHYIQGTPAQTPAQTPRVVGGYGPTVIRVGAPPPPQFYERPPPMHYYAPHPMHRPIFYGPPPPPMAQPPIIVRPRFFSPPPPRMRPMPYMMPPGGPPPIFAPPIYVRRNRPASRSGSRSSSQGSRSKSPAQRPGENGLEDTVPKRVPNGDADTSSDSTIGKRPETPPTDYGKKPRDRMSRRDQYEYRYRRESPPRHIPVPYEQYQPPGMYDYYVYPPRHGGYEPFMMYNPHARARSLPPRERSKSPHKKGKKKHKKGKKKQRKPQKANDYRRTGYYPRSDISTDSHTGYHSELPSRKPVADSDGGYQFYPPRDFRRNENQFINERNFSKSIIEETRRSRDSRAYPTAYEMNDQMTKNAKDEDADFTMY